MNTLFALDYPTASEAALGVKMACEMQQRDARETGGVIIIDAMLAHGDQRDPADGSATVLVLVAGVHDGPAIMAILGGEVRHAAITPHEGSRIRQAGEARPARTEPDVVEAVASLDCG